LKLFIATLMQICENIKLAREKSGLSQNQAAKILGEKRTTYANWEKNIEPTLSKIKLISEKFGTPISELLKGVIDFDPQSAEKKKNVDTGPVALVIDPDDVDKVKESLRILNAALEAPVDLSKKYPDHNEHPNRNSRVNEHDEPFGEGDLRGPVQQLPLGKKKEEKK
jgi:transcriptional regulator with XRE-family HTH domain